MCRTSLADVRDSQMRTPLMLAVEGGYAQCTDVLLGCNSSVDLFDVNRRTALHRAASRGFEDCVISLLEAKATVNVPDCRGKTPLHLSSAAGHVNVLKLLIQHCNVSVAVTATDAQNTTPLHWAAYKGNYCIYVARKLPAVKDDCSGCHFSCYHTLANTRSTLRNLKGIFTQQILRS